MTRRVDVLDPGRIEVVVMVGVCVLLALDIDVYVVVEASLQPKKFPGVRQVVDVTVYVAFVGLEVLDVVAVDLSRQPHHPGVLQVSVRVRV